MLWKEIPYGSKKNSSMAGVLVVGEKRFGGVRDCCFGQKGQSLPFSFQLKRMDKDLTRDLDEVKRGWKKVGGMSMTTTCEIIKG